MLVQSYTDDDNEDEDSITTSRVTTTVAKTTTTAPKWPFHQHGKNTRANGRGSTGAEYNGHQPKNDYPPMSAHSVYKWRTLGSRESVKQTMNSMRQSNNGERKCTSDLEYASNNPRLGFLNISIGEKKGWATRHIEDERSV